MEKLTQKGVTNEIAAVLEGGHNWATADKHMRQTLPLHWAALGPHLRVTSVTKLPEGEIHVEGKGVPRALHRVQITADLEQAFEDVRTVEADAEGNLVFEDSNASGPAPRFYRFVYP